MYNLTKTHLSRRTVLRGAGAAVSLPLLGAMVPAGTALAQTAAAPQLKLGFVYFPHGAVADQWTPKGVGTEFELSPILAALEPYKDKMAVLSGTRNKPGEAPPTHAIVPGTWLTAIAPTVGSNSFGGITIDQMLAEHLGQETPLPSLEIATEESTQAGACDRAYGCTYGHTISFRTPTQPLPMEYNPRKLFYRLFGEGDSEAERELIVNQYKSVLDQVSESAAALKGRLGPTDRAMLDDYLGSVREIERRIQKMGNQDFTGMELPDAPVGVPENYDEQLDLMYDLLALAYQAGLTRVGSMMTQAEVSNLTFNQIGVSDAFHPLSHHQNNQAKLDRLARVQTYNTEHFARFVEKLANIPDGENTLLDNMLIMYGSNMGDSNQHSQDQLPTTLIGGAAGKLKGGQHLNFAQDTPHANTLLTILQKSGVEIDSIGNSTGVISEI